MISVSALTLAEIGIIKNNVYTKGGLPFAYTLFFYPLLAEKSCSEYIFLYVVLLGGRGFKRILNTLVIFMTHINYL